MYHYLQFRADKKESWHLVDESQLSKLDRPPSFLSVLKVDQDIEALEEAGEDALETAKYRGPMYFDLDCEDDIDAVLDSSRELIEKLKNKYDIDPAYLHCWLSGGKGVHITIPERIFGVDRATQYLPLIYKQIAKEVEVEYLDMGVYSAGKGRLWRCEQVARPGSGTFKVGVTVEELEDLDAQGYEVMVATPRPPLERAYPEPSVAYPKARTAFKRAKQAAVKIAKSIKNAKVIPNEEIRKLEETPGCIEKLVKQGDCPESNYNQAAMQVAAWVAARYDKNEEAVYQSEVVEPFIVNVQSSSRPSEQERRKHLKDQINRAFTGKTKFQVGPLIATIGEPCQACPLCRGDLKVEDYAKEVEGTRYDPGTKIKETGRGYAMVKDEQEKLLTSFIFLPDSEIKELEEDAQTGVLRETQRQGFVGTLIDETGQKFYDVNMPESAWNSRTNLQQAVSGYGAAKVLCTDAEIAKISLAILRFRAKEETMGDIMTQTRICGVHFDRVGKKAVVPTYIEAGASVRAGSDPDDRQVYPSRFRYSGEHNMSPQLIDADYPYVDDDRLEEALDCLLKINDDANVARMVGWFAACHLREHIHQVIPQFPLLNVWGNAGAGKTMTVLLLCHLNGMDYQSHSEPLNMENATPFPLQNFVTSSTTVPRFVEEVNESLMDRRMYNKTMGVFKAAWNRATVNRGKLGKNGPVSENSRVSAPIVYVSEQRTTRPSLQNRTIEVMLTAAGREKAGRSPAFKRAYLLRHDLFRAAKAMLHRSLTLSPLQVGEMLEKNEELVPENMDERPRFSMLVTMMGLDFMADALAASQIDFRERLMTLKQSLSDYLNDNFVELEAEKRVSEVDRVLLALDQMAAEPEDRSHGIRPDDHYVKIGSHLSLNLALIVSRYRRWCRSVGEMAVLTDVGQLGHLLSGEVYFDRKQQDAERPGVTWHVIDLDKLKAKGTHLANFAEDRT